MGRKMVFDMNEPLTIFEVGAEFDFIDAVIERLVEELHFVPMSRTSIKPTRFLLPEPDFPAGVVE
jgi:hypothetical protein